MTKQSKTTQPTTATSKLKPQTLSEFKAWLSGVEEMQPDGWAPDLTQWRRIRQRIENIVESRTRVTLPHTDEYDETTQPRHIRPAGPSLMTPNATQVTTPSVPPTFMAADPNQRAKAPNIDTSKQPYASSLE